jgi:hypothetical protein
LSVLGTQKPDIGCVGPNDTLNGIFQQEQEADRFLDIVFGVLQRMSNVLLF